jgi:hypothetical protein
VESKSHKVSSRLPWHTDSLCCDYSVSGS